MLPRIEKLWLAVINVSLHLLVGMFVSFITVTLMEKWKYMNLIRPVTVNEVERLTGVFLWSPQPSDVARSVNTKPGSNYQMDTGYFIIPCILHENLNWPNNTRSAAARLEFNYTGSRPNWTLFGYYYSVSTWCPNLPGAVQRSEPHPGTEIYLGRFLYETILVTNKIVTASVFHSRLLALGVGNLRVSTIYFLGESERLWWMSS